MLVWEEPTRPRRKKKERIKETSATMCWLRTSTRCDGLWINLICIFSMVYLYSATASRSHLRRMTKWHARNGCAETVIDPIRMRMCMRVYMNIQRTRIIMCIQFGETEYRTKGIMQHIGVEIVLKFHPALVRIQWWLHGYNECSFLFEFCWFFFF